MKAIVGKDWGNYKKGDEWEGHESTYDALKSKGIFVNKKPKTKKE